MLSLRFNFVIAGLPENDGGMDTKKLLGFVMTTTLELALPKPKSWKQVVSVKFPLEENRNYCWSNQNAKAQIALKGANK